MTKYAMQVVTEGESGEVQFMTGFWGETADIAEAITGESIAERANIASLALEMEEFDPSVTLTMVEV